MNREREIEEAIMNSPETLGFPRALAIRNIRLDTNKRAGRLDVLLLPRSGPHKLVLVEAKISTAPDADGKCIGQLVKYLSFALRIGTEGHKHLLRYAAENSDDARSVSPTTPKKLLGVRREADGESLLQQGDSLTPGEIALFIAINGESHGALPIVTATLNQYFNLPIGIAIVKKGSIRIAKP